MRAGTLIFVPTYNERENAPQMVERLDALGLDADILFMDDGSPDGTGELLDEIAAGRSDFHVIHREGKLGIGSAHLDGIRWAYDRGYARLVTLDCDFSHSPEDVPRFLAALESGDVVVGSRFLKADSLPGWNAFRRTLTRFGHGLTKFLLAMPQDATGAFRAYDLGRVPRSLWDLVRSRGYSFFFETCFLIARNGLRIEELPIVLPARTYGHSKMSPAEALKSGFRVWKLWFQSKARPEQFVAEKPLPEIDRALVDPQRWDEYWLEQGRASNRVYEAIATVYRNLVIRGQLTRQVRRTFPKGARLLHAGCGSGHVDVDICHEMRITAVDISPAALRVYNRSVPAAEELRHASIFDLPYPDDSFDGVYNLGVLEHFESAEIDAILREFRRVLRPGGRVLVFWPHARASSVVVLRLARRVVGLATRREVRFHPDEVSLMRSRGMAEELFGRAGFEVERYQFGPRDLFVQVVVEARVR